MRARVSCLDRIAVLALLLALLTRQPSVLLPALRLLAVNPPPTARSFVRRFGWHPQPLKGIGHQPARNRTVGHDRRFAENLELKAFEPPGQPFTQGDRSYNRCPGAGRPPHLEVWCRPRRHTGRVKSTSKKHAASGGRETKFRGFRDLFEGTKIPRGVPFRFTSRPPS